MLPFTFQASHPHKMADTVTVYAMPDSKKKKKRLEKKRQSDGEGQTIYDRVDDVRKRDIVPGPQQNTAGRQTQDKLCPNGWQKFGFRCYQRSSEEKTWEESRQHCLKTGADLVVINRKKVQEFIKSLSSGRGASWIGLNNTEGKWTWVDGTPLTTGYWASGGPDNNTNHNCVKYNHDQGDWIDANCGEGFRCICEK